MILIVFLDWLLDYLTTQLQNFSLKVNEIILCGRNNIPNFRTLNLKCMWKQHKDSIVNTSYFKYL